MKITDFDDIITKGDVLVDFYATWCGPCKMMQPILDELKDDFKIIKIDVDENKELAKNYGVMSIPTLIYFKDKDSFDKKIGFMSKEDVLKWINNFK